MTPAEVEHIVRNLIAGHCLKVDLHEEKIKQLEMELAAANGRLDWALGALGRASCGLPVGRPPEESR